MNIIKSVTPLAGCPAAALSFVTLAVTPVTFASSSCAHALAIVSVAKLLSLVITLFVLLPNDNDFQLNFQTFNFQWPRVASGLTPESARFAACNASRADLVYSICQSTLLVEW
jgi:hypothetical protein